MEPALFDALLAPRSGGCGREPRDCGGSGGSDSGGLPLLYAAALCRCSHLTVVQWLHANRKEGCTTDAMDYAARNGHLTVVQWLHANRKEGCTTGAMDSAARNGHLPVVQWLHANRSERCTAATMDAALLHGRVCVVQWLLANRTEDP
jgi:hypothetical protein